MFNNEKYLQYKNKQSFYINELPKLYPDSFDWSRWRLGIAIWRELGISCRYYDIIEQGEVLRKFAIGYLPGHKLICRPILNEVAVMFIIDDDFCWTHLRKEEFYNLFKIK